MNETIKHIIKNNSFYGYKIIVDENMGYFRSPTMDDLEENIVFYISIIHQYIEIYEDDKENFYLTVFTDELHIQNFVYLLKFFFNIETLNYVDGKIYFNDVNYIDNDNIGIFMEALRIIHHLDKKSDDYEPENEVAVEMIKRSRELKKEMEKKIKSKDGTGFLEISSTICARHPSINPTNIGKMNYFQIIDQFKRLGMIDLYSPCIYGNATEEYIKKIDHYSSKIINQ